MSPSNIPLMLKSLSLSPTNLLILTLTFYTSNDSSFIPKPWLPSYNISETIPVIGLYFLNHPTLILPIFLFVDEKNMRDRMERLVLLPFSIGCVSESSVAIALPHPPHKNPLPSHHASPIRKREEDEESSSSTESMKNGFKFLALPKPNISDRFHRLVRNIKTITQLFEYKDEMEEVEMEMEIGLPTDVKHVTHIGLDGTSNNNPIQGWDNLIPPELLSLHQPCPFTQFEISSQPSSSQNTPSPSKVALASTT